MGILWYKIKRKIYRLIGVDQKKTIVIIDAPQSFIDSCDKIKGQREEVIKIMYDIQKIMNK